MSDNEFDDIMKAMPSNISKLDSVYMCFKDEHDKWCDSIKNAYAENNDKGMGELGWVKLPVSEDGDVLHIGELVDEKLPFGGYAAPAPIDTMELSRGASGYVWMVKLDAENRALINPRLLRHHHEPTVEDVLRGFADEMNQNLGMYTGEAIDADEWRDADARTVEKFSAKLRLAGEDE